MQFSVLAKKFLTLLQMHPLLKILVLLNLVSFTSLFFRKLILNLATEAPTGFETECTLLSGYGYEIVSKWDFGEQIKITTTFESDVHSALSLKDESYLKVN